MNLSNINRVSPALVEKELLIKPETKANVSKPDSSFGNKKEAGAQVLTERMFNDLGKGSDKPIDTNKTTVGNKESTLADVNSKQARPRITAELQENNHELASPHDKGLGSSELRSLTDGQKKTQHGKDGDTGVSEGRPGRGSSSEGSRVGNRRGRPYDEEESEEDASRRRRKQATFLQQQARKPLTILEGARVGESQTQDMFVSSSVTAERISGKVNRTVIEQIKEYNLGPIGCNVYDAVYANSNGKEKNGIGPNMQKDLFAEIMKGIAEVDDVMSPEYRRLVRDVVQGAMEAGQETRIDLKDVVKMLVSGFMAMSPHDDDPQIMAEAIKHIVSEVMYGKINIGYNMKSAAYNLGAALHTLQLYYKNYQQDIKYTKELEQKINSAFSENVWKATGEISNYSQVYAKANIEQFMAGKQDEEKAYNKNVVKDLVFSPLKKVFNKT